VGGGGSKGEAKGKKPISPQLLKSTLRRGNKRKDKKRTQHLVVTGVQDLFAGGPEEGGTLPATEAKREASLATFFSWQLPRGSETTSSLSIKNFWGGGVSLHYASNRYFTKDRETRFGRV